MKTSKIAFIILGIVAAIIIIGYGKNLISCSGSNPTRDDFRDTLSSNNTDTTDTTAFAVGTNLVVSESSSNEITGEINGDVVTFRKVTRWEDGTDMNDDRVDGIVYLKKDDDYFKREFDGPVMASWFGAVGDGKTDDTKALQKLLQSDYKNISLEKNKTYLVSKNINLSGFPNGDQPCLLIVDKKDIVLNGNNATLKVNQHAQGALEIQQSKNITIKNLNVVGAGNFPPIDGKTGYGEKGVEGKGYYTSGFWGYYKNNSKNTSRESRGGFNKKFPQFNSGKSANTWGIWNGGFIGNVSYGILIHNACDNIVIENCSAKYFNYVGIGVGHNGDFYPKDLKYKASRNIVFKNCRADHNYSAGFHSMDVNNFRLTNCVSNESGHPDASASHEFCNPGYGYTARGSYRYTQNGIIENSTFTDNKRKGLDVHAGRAIIFRNNKVSKSYVSGIYAAWSNETQPSFEITISNNVIDSCGIGPASLGAIYLGASAGAESNDKYLRSTVEGNKITNYGGAGIRVRYGNTAIIKDNVITNAVKGSSPNLSAILVTGQNERSRAHSVEILNNKIFEQNGNIVRAIQLSYVDESNIENNQVSFHSDADNALMVRSSNNIFVDRNDIQLKGKGAKASIPTNFMNKVKNKIELQQPK